MKKLFAICLMMAFFMAAFSPPSYSSPPLKHGTEYVIPTLPVQTITVNTVIETGYGYLMLNSTINPVELKVCGFARDWPVKSNLISIADNILIDTDYSLRTCRYLNSTFDNRKDSGHKPYGNYKPRDGLKA